MNESSDVITLDAIRQSLSSALVCDALDSLGLTRQSPRLPINPLTTDGVLVGRCKTTLWSDLAHTDPSPYEKELLAVDGCRPDDVIIAATGGSTRSAIWGELLSIAARNSGCVGVIVDGFARDVVKMKAMAFPVFARGTSPYDSKNRQRVTDIDIPVEIDGVLFYPGELVLADVDGIVVIPRAVENEAIQLAWQKVHAESRTRAAIEEGLKATEAYRRYGVL